MLNRIVLGLVLAASLLLQPAASRAQLNHVAPEPYIPMRGLQTDLSSASDRFVSLDMNGDGRADLLYWNADLNNAGVHLSHGDGTFRYVPYVSGGRGRRDPGYQAVLTTAPDSIVPRDLNGDGKDDFISYNQGFAFRCLSNGDGTVNCDRLSAANGFADDLLDANAKIIAVRRAGAASEFVVYEPNEGSIRLYVPQTGSNMLQALDLTKRGFLPSDIQKGISVISLDANGDGLGDLLLLSPAAGRVEFYSHLSGDTFNRTTLVASPYGYAFTGFVGNFTSGVAHVIAIDLNGDGKQDFLWWQAGGNTVIGCLSNGDGNFTAINYEVNGNAGRGFQDFAGHAADTAAAVDLNGDGKQDLLWYSPGNAILSGYLSSSTGDLKKFTPGLATVDTNNSPNAMALPVNFLGEAASAFLWYVPGSGANGAPAFQAFRLTNSDPNSPTCCFGSGTVYNFFTKTSTFMTDMNWSLGDVPLKAVVMPGTHDSAMYNLEIGINDISETQWGDLTYQLNHGARYFDIRNGEFKAAGYGPLFTDPTGKTMVSNPSFTVGFGQTILNLFGHDTILSQVSTLTALNTIEDWLQDHNGEVVLLDMNDRYPNSTDLVNLIKSTSRPAMVYSPMLACGSTSSCKNANLLPQNMTVNKLRQVGTNPMGARLILVRQGSAPGYEWPGVVDNQVGYCDSGEEVAYLEIDCINNGGSPLGQYRPSFQAADAAMNFTHVVAALTPFGNAGTNGGLGTPLVYADGNTTAGATTPDPYGNPIYGFNNGLDPNDLNQQLIAGAWSSNALNAVTIDGIGADNVAPDYSQGVQADIVAQLLIQRNNQTWIDQHFFNNNLDTPAAALSIGASGDIWAAGGGHSVSLFKYDPTAAAWKSLVNGEPNVQKLAVTPQGGVYVLNSSCQVQYFDRYGVSRYSPAACGTDIAVDKNGNAWVCTGEAYLFAPVTGSQHGLPAPGSGCVHIAVDNQGNPWITEADGSIYRYNGASWIQIAAASGFKATEIVASPDGSMFVIGKAEPSVYRYNPETDTFDPLIMDAAHIAVEPGGQPWAIRNGTGAVYKGSIDQIATWVKQSFSNGH